MSSIPGKFPQLPRHAYRSPIIKRYRGKTKGCPVFNNITDIRSNMVEQHDECLECLSKIKNRNDLYRTLAENNKPSNNVIKSLQRLSQSASNNRLKMCLQFLIINANEKSAAAAQQSAKTNATTGSNNISNSPKPLNISTEIPRYNEHSSILNLKQQNKRQKSHTTTNTTTSTTTTTTTNNNSNSNNEQPKHNHLASPQQDLVSSTQDQVEPVSWSPAHESPPSPASSTSSISSSSSCCSSSSCSFSSMSSSPSPLSSPDIVDELKGPRLKLSEEKIRKIKKRPVLYDGYYNDHSSASTPTTSSGCSPGQHSDQSRLGFPASNSTVHMFQAPPKFVNSLKPWNVPTVTKAPTPVKTPPAPTREMLNCAICGIKESPPSICKIYGQYSCTLCAKFFGAFLKRPQQFYCVHDGDCLMTFDSRCQACWVKICLQKFDIDENHREIGHKFSPKLLSAPNVSLITIDTSLITS